MSDHVAKFVTKLTPVQRDLIEALLLKVKSGDLTGLDVKKLVGGGGLYRVRKGKIRIVFDDRNRIIDIDFRGNIYQK